MDLRKKAVRSACFSWRRGGGNIPLGLALPPSGTEGEETIN